MSVAREQLRFIDDIITETTLKNQALRGRLSQLSIREKEVLHIMELGTYNVVEGYYLVVAMKKILQERREIKDELEVLSLITEKFNISNVQMVESKIVKKEKILSTRGYTFETMTVESDSNLLKLMRNVKYRAKNNNSDKLNVLFTK